VKFMCICSIIRGAWSTHYAHLLLKYLTPILQLKLFAFPFIFGAKCFSFKTRLLWFRFNHRFCVYVLFLLTPSYFSPFHSSKASNSCWENINICCFIWLLYQLQRKKWNSNMLRDWLMVMPILNCILAEF
jgi:hypothetical protein